MSTFRITFEDVVILSEQSESKDLGTIVMLHVTFVRRFFDPAAIRSE